MHSFIHFLNMKKKLNVAFKIGSSGQDISIWNKFYYDSFILYGSIYNQKYVLFVLMIYIFLQL